MNAFLAKLVAGGADRAPYAWIITVDHINTTEVAEGDTNPMPSRVGVTGPSAATDAQIAKLKAGEGHAFRMRDDDGELYYEGRFLGDEKSEEAFGPLDDFGLPDAGATSIEYRNAAGGWEAL